MLWDALLGVLLLLTEIGVRFSNDCSFRVKEAHRLVHKLAFARLSELLRCHKVNDLNL